MLALQALRALLAACCWLPTVHAQDAGVGSRLYLGLPGGQAACVECHGPDPGLDRNRLLNAAQGAAAIDVALRKAAAMGYLNDLLTPSDKADVSAWLQQVLAEVDGSAAAVVWPWGLEFGLVAPGASLQPQRVQLHNRSALELQLNPRLRSLVPGGAVGLTVTHDCPTSLPAGATCSVLVGYTAGPEGRVQAALEWGDAAAALRPVGVAATVTQAAHGRARWLDVQDPSVVSLQAVAGSTALVALPLQNQGSVAMTLGMPAITGPGRAAFRMDGSGCTSNQTLMAGEPCTVRLQASASAAGRYEATLQWRTDGGHAPLRRLALTVAAAPVAPPAPPPAPATPTSPESTPAPAPAPGLTPQPPADSAGGCSRRALDAGSAYDPLLSGLIAGAGLLLWARSRRGAPSA